MHVGFNLVFLVPGEIGGMETYARELIPELVALRPQSRYTAFVGREAADREVLPLPREVERVVVPVRASNRVEWVRGEQVLLPRLARRAGVDVLHSMASTGPGWGAYRRVTTVHDLIYRRFPEAHFGVRTVGMRLLVPLAARRSARVIADSESTVADIERFLGIPADRIDHVPLGLRYVPPDPGRVEPAARVRERWDLGERDVALTLSAKRPVKNLDRLLQALALLPAGERPVLVLPGYRTPLEDDLRRLSAELGVEEDVRIPGWLPGDQVEGLWSVARCFVFPSLYEGFGLPILEAMARGVPVACSDASSLPEVAGDAARYFDPTDTESIAAALRELLADGALRERLATRGRERAAQFTWRETAERTFASYERALSS